jgi:hypothetical protein
MAEEIKWKKVSKNEQASKKGAALGDGSTLPFYKVIKNEQDGHWYCFALHSRSLQYQQLNCRYLSITDAKKTCHDVMLSNGNR